MKRLRALRFEGDRISWIMADGQVSTGTFRLDANKTPKELDVHLDDERGMRGLYRLEGDTLTTCLGHPGGPRPADFVTDRAGKVFLLVLRREAAAVALPPAPPDGSVRRFAGHQSPVKAVAFSPDGLLALSGSGYPDGLDCSLRLWKVATGKELRRYGRHAGPVMSVAFSPDGRLVVSGSTDGMVRLFDRESGREVQYFRTPTQNFINRLVFSRDGQRLLTGGDPDCRARWWDVAGARSVREFTGHTGFLTSVALSPDGRFALTGSKDQTARLWEVATGRELHRLKGHKAMVEGVAFSPDGRHAATCGQDAAVLLWDVKTGRQVRAFPGHRGKVMSVAFSPDGTRLLTGGGDMTLRLWNAQTGKLLGSFRGHTAVIWSVAFAPDGKHALSASGDKTLRLWQLPAMPKPGPGRKSGRP
jgi:uncharacterized protein (TIGR03067 family)